MEKTAVDITPSMDRFRNAFGGLWRGGAAGVISGIGMALLGAAPGSVAGGLLAGAVLGGTDGRTVAIVSGMEAAQVLFTDSAA